MKHPNYFIKDGYTNNPVMTFDSDDSDSYWTPEFIKDCQRWQRPVYQEVSKYLRQQGIKRFIDVGCGAAVKLELIHKANPQLEIIGIDQQSAIHWNQKNLPFGKWIAANLDEPLQLDPPLQAPAVLCCDVIEHVARPDLLLATLKKLCTPGGKIFVSTPDRYILRGPHSKQPDNKYHVREWNAEEFAQFVESEGFVIEEHRHLFPKDLGFHRGALDFIIKPWLKGRPFKFSQLLRLRIAE
jgi:SAM-dependent methyltransferase